jgi:hypothetical protein
MQTALAITLAFVAATSALGGLRASQAAMATGHPSEYGGAAVAFSMTLWCAFLAGWVLLH